MQAASRQVAALTLQVETFDSLAAVGRGAWNTLVQSADGASVFQTFEWHNAWLKTIGANRPVRIYGVRENGALLGLAALSESSPREWRFVGHGASDYNDLIVKPGRRDATVLLCSALSELTVGWRCMRLQNLPAESPAIDALLGVTGRSLVSNKVPCPTLEIAGHEEGFERVRRKKSLRRHHNFFRKQENYSVRHLRDAASIQPFLADFFEQHAARWRLRGQASLFDAEVNRRFYRQLVEEFDRTEWLVFTVLSLGGRPVAQHLGFDFRSRFLWYKPSFDPALAKKSPGEALLAELFDLADQAGTREFDFTVGDEAFKLRFANKVRHNQTVEVYSAWSAYYRRRLYLGARDGAKRMAIGRVAINSLRRVLGRN